MFRPRTPDAKADNVQGTTLYPTGEKDGIWWKVSDETGNEGWVPSPLFNMAK